MIIDRVLVLCLLRFLGLLWVCFHLLLFCWDQGSYPWRTGGSVWSPESSQGESQGSITPSPCWKSVKIVELVEWRENYGFIDRKTGPPGHRYEIKQAHVLDSVKCTHRVVWSFARLVVIGDPRPVAESYLAWLRRFRPFSEGLYHCSCSPCVLHCSSPWCHIGFPQS